MDVSIVNACILYNREKSSRTRVPLLDFREAVATGLLERHQFRTDCRHPAPTIALPMRLTETRSFPEKIPPKMEQVADLCVKFVDPKGKGHKPVSDVKLSKLHCTVILAWSFTILKVTIQNRII